MLACLFRYYYIFLSFLKFLVSCFLFLVCCPGNSLSLRKRYDALHAAARQRKELVDEAVTRRQDFDKALDNFLGPLGELEAKCDGLQDKGESKPAHIQERVETIRVSQGKV